MRAEEFTKYVDPQAHPILRRHAGETIDVFASESKSELRATRVANNRITDNVAHPAEGVSFMVALGQHLGETTFYQAEGGLDSDKSALTTAVEIADAAPELPWFKGFPEPTPQRLKMPVRRIRNGLLERTMGEAIGIYKKNGFQLSGVIQYFTFKEALYRYLGRKRGTISWCGTQVRTDLVGTDSENTVETHMMSIGDNLRALHLGPMLRQGVRELRRQQELDVHKIEPGKYPVLIDAKGMMSVLEFLAWHGIDGSAYQRNDTFTRNNRIGEKICARQVTITDEPFDRRNPFQVPTDGWGIQKYPMQFIRNGVLMARWYDFWSAQKYNVPPTGHGGNVAYGPGHLCLKPGNGPSTEHEALQRLGDGIYIRDLYYTRMEDSASGEFTGMTRYGTYLVKDGKIAARLPNLRFVETVPHLLQQVKWLSQQDTAIFTSESYGAEALPVFRAPLYTQIDEFHVTGSTPTGQVSCNGRSRK